MTTWFIIFSDPDPLGEKAGWLDRLFYRLLGCFKPGFRHCYAMRRAEKFDGWLIINPVSSGIDVQEVDDNKMTVGGQEFGSYGHFVESVVQSGQAFRVEARCRPGRYVKLRGLFSCVGVIKHLLSMSSPWVWTPWQLYRKLGGESNE